MMLSQFIPESIRSVSIIGMSKNAGKTTVFNTLLEEMQERGKRMGLVSVGVDGEETDVWSGLPKPPICVKTGDLVATNKLAIEQAEARFEILEKIKDSAIGHEVYLLRTTKGGRVKLAGTPSLHEVERVLEGFARYGSEFSLVDGAYDRIASATPFLTQGLILVVGASYHRSLSVILEKTRKLFFQKTLPGMDDSLVSDEVKPHLNRNRAVWMDASDQRFTLLPYPLRQGWSKGLTGENPYLFLPGALTTSILMEAHALEPAPILVIQDGTRVFAEWREIASFYRRGGEIRVRIPMRLLAVCINPFSPDGYQFDRELMAEKVKEIVGQVPVIDVVRGKCW